MDKKYTECSRCGKAINYGNAYVSIVRNVEQAEFDLATNSEEIEVINSDEIIALCGSCGNSFNADTIANIINAVPSGSTKITDN